MFDRKGSIILIALGSVIVILGIVLYAMNFAGSYGLIGFGALVEALGLFYFIKNNKNDKS